MGGDSSIHGHGVRHKLAEVFGREGSYRTTPAAAREIYSAARDSKKQEGLSALTATWSVHKRIDDLERLINFTLGYFDDLTNSEKDAVLCSLAYVKLPYIQYAFEVEAVPPEKRSEIFNKLLGLCRRLGLRMDTGSDRLDGTGLSEFDHEDAEE